MSQHLLGEKIMTIKGYYFNYKLRDHKNFLVIFEQNKEKKKENHQQQNHNLSGTDNLS
jgi:hypothetical protein